MSKANIQITKDFFKRYTQFDVPHDTILRNNTTRIFEECMSDGVQLFAGDRIYTIIDETPCNNETIAGFIVGSLDFPEKGPLLMHLKAIQTQCDTKAYTDFYLEGLKKVYPNGTCNY